MAKRGGSTCGATDVPIGYLLRCHGWSGGPSVAAVHCLEGSLLGGPSVAIQIHPLILVNFRHNDKMNEAVLERF